MKNLFDELKKVMKRWDLYQADDEVDMALTDLENAINMEFRVYLVNYRLNSDEFNWSKGEPTDEQFMNEAELQGTVFTLEGFVDTFNVHHSEVNQETDMIRIIQVPVSLPV